MKLTTIGTIKFKNPLFLAPMLEVTDLPYRILCRKAGCAMAYTEMINAEAILHKNKKTAQMMQTCPADSPLGIQITGNNEKDFSSLAPTLKKYSLTDINCGCPSDKMVLSNRGSCLLKTPDKISKIIKILKKEGLIVTAKIRLGFNKNNVLKIAKTIEKAGADAIAVHARLATESYSLPADWKQIKIIKSHLSIPVIGNGDITNGETAKEMLELSDFAMIGRAAIGNPLIFSQILHYLKTGKEKEITAKQRIQQFREYLKLSKEYKLINLSKIKYLGANFLKGFENAGKARNQLMAINSFEEIDSFVKRY